MGQDSQNEIVGRGARDGAELFRQWFSSLGETAEQGAQCAYVFVMGSMNEILKAFVQWFWDIKNLMTHTL